MHRTDRMEKAWCCSSPGHRPPPRWLEEVWLATVWDRARAAAGSQTSRQGRSGQSGREKRLLAYWNKTTLREVWAQRHQLLQHSLQHQFQQYPLLWHRFLRRLLEFHYQHRLLQRVLVCRHPLQLHRQSLNYQHQWCCSSSAPDCPQYQPPGLVTWRKTVEITILTTGIWETVLI